LVQAMVTKLTKFGAFAQLVDVPEIEGLIHISELSDKRVTHPREVVNEGDKLTLRVVKIDIENRRLGLSLKKVNSAEYLDLDWASSFGNSNEQTERSEDSPNKDRVEVKPESTEEAEGPTEASLVAKDQPIIAPNPESTEEAEGPTEDESTIEGEQDDVHSESTEEAEAE
jgi:ribosomal protein S1